ncbi:hypothetical protein [Streptomyces sp. NPDC050263]|uniref:hypothetical protein n=1 Tax=Streptomyces sp. NPDC050263 TaxID=3155037 RepID=UPI00343D77B6
MRRTTRKSRAALVASAASAAMLAGSVALAPGAGAVTPDRATAQYDCGAWGPSTTTFFTATQSGSAATITVTLSSLTAPIPVQTNSVTSTLVLAENGGWETTEFTGTINPYLSVGDPFVLGPLSGTVAPDDSLDSSAGGPYSLRMVLFGITINCVAKSTLSPGPFVF